VHDLRFLHGHATTALTWLIIAAPEAMPPVTDHDCSKKLKALLRKAGERTRDGLWSAITHILQLYTPAECRNLFRNSGYSTWSVTALTLQLHFPIWL
jgi:hypothetical protein